MLNCESCGTDGRIENVNEHSINGIEITYICPNPRCTNYQQIIGVENLSSTSQEYDI